MAKKFKLGTLTEDDLDQDYAPGRSEETMSDAHRASLARMVERTRRAARRVRKSGERIVVVLEPE